MKIGETQIYKGFKIRKTAREDAFKYIAEATLFSSEFTNKPVPRKYYATAKSLPMIKNEVDTIWYNKEKLGDIHYGDVTLFEMIKKYR